MAEIESGRFATYWRLEPRRPSTPDESAAAREVTQRIEQRLPDLTSRPALIRRQLPAAALARATRLERAVIVLEDAGPRDVAALPLRPIAELFMIGIYLLYGGPEAYEYVLNAHVHELRKLPAEHFSDLHQELESWEGKTERINWYNLSRDVGRLLQKAGDEAGAEAGRSIYGLLWRGTSLLDVHGGFQTIAGHITDDGDKVGLAVERRDADEGLASSVIGAVLITVLASHVYERFGFGTADLQEAHARLGESKTMP